MIRLQMWSARAASGLGAPKSAHNGRRVLCLRLRAAAHRGARPATAQVMPGDRGAKRPRVDSS